MARAVELSCAIDAALAALDEDDFQGYSSQLLSSGDDFECQLQMKVQVFQPPAVEDDVSSSANSTAMDAALAALDEDDFEGYSSQSLSSGDDFECQLQMKVQVFQPPAEEDDVSSSGSSALEDDVSSSEGSTAASETGSSRSLRSLPSKWRSKASAFASRPMLRLVTA